MASPIRGRSTPLRVECGENGEKTRKQVGEAVVTSEVESASVFPIAVAVCSGISASLPRSSLSERAGSSQCPLVVFV